MEVTGREAPSVRSSISVDVWASDASASPSAASRELEAVVQEETACGEGGGCGASQGPAGPTRSTRVPPGMRPLSRAESQAPSPDRGSSAGRWEAGGRGSGVGAEGARGELHPGQLQPAASPALGAGFSNPKHSNSLDSSFATKVKIISLSVLFCVQKS